MFFNFVDELRAAGIGASFKEHLTLLEALDKDVIEQTPEAFYYLSRATFVKDEGLLDRFDQVFQKVFKGIMTDYGQNPVDIPEDWLKAVAEKFLTPEEMEERNRSLGRDPRQGYDNFERELSEEQRAAFRAEGRQPSLRLRVPDEDIVITDMIRGEITFPAGSFTDFVVVRPNGARRA